MLRNTKPPTAPKEAVALLRAGDKLVCDLFADYEATHITAKKQLVPAGRSQGGTDGIARLS